MQYDLKETLKEQGKVKLTWHGEDTKVLFEGDAVKTEVKKGDVVEVSLEQARQLLNYSNLWTLEGDEPTKQPYLERMKKKAVKKVSKTDQKSGDGAKKTLSVEEVDGMEKKDVVKALKKLKATFNDQAEEKDLKALLKETLTGLETDQKSGDGAKA